MGFLLGSNSVGFLTLHNIDDIGYLSSFLITDYNGIPLEFRCTHPIKPDSVQITLYGPAFLSHVGVDLFGKPLLRSSDNKPKLIFVDKVFLLKLNEYSSCPIVLVKSTDEEDNSPISNTLDAAYHLEVIKSRSDRYEPLEIIKKKEKKKSKTKELIEKIYSEFDVKEPFERMKKAVETIVRQQPTHK